ncbi:hypothetical protein N0V84_009435 [Fusarium piperis]|uniref:Uncharacterized protein n=1 Tax=Fusarium piperis TaxID=1435070 RepID=A0A9W8W6D5_9HYPO|nr:hypothetical protein N0V84_009435 [Fusarium piperis]
MSEISIKESIEFDDGTPDFPEPVNELVDDAIDSDTWTDDESDHLVDLPRSSDDDDDSLDGESENNDFRSMCPSPDEVNAESIPEAESSRTVADDSPAPRTTRFSQLFAKFTEEFLDIVQEDAQEAVIAATRAQKTEVGQLVKKHDRDIANARGEMKSLKRSINKRDLSNSAFQNDVSERFASLEQSAVDRILMLEKIISSRMTRLEKSINGRLASLEQSMNDRFAELEDSID